MQTSEEIKYVVKEKYSEIANRSSESSGCGCGCSKASDYTDFSDDYSKLAGYNRDADMGLGCGVPTELAHINRGDTVLDLGSGAGNDVFVARALVGDSGKVIGVDMTEDMIAKANTNLEKLGFDNIEFRLGEIENLPVTDSEVDVVISNCVLNLVPDKKSAFAELFRSLRPGGHFCVSDIVLVGDLPDALKKSAEMYAGCVAGALQKSEYLQLLKDAGFEKIAVKEQKTVNLDDETLQRFLNNDELQRYRESEMGIFSITVYGVKPAL
jgi:ubiquinone/menaquinone biosynthesis C-methylase UbiE